MTRDGAHGLDLSYNRLNLIEKVVRSGATLANYSYLSDGTKVSATNGAGDGFFYAGSLVYRKAGDRLTLESAGFDGGRFVVTNTGVEPRYFESDHLGSTRVVVNAGGEVLERNDYYPYGMRWSDPSSLLSDNRYGYNGKERQDFVDLPYLDYGARMYDPIRGIWIGQDPLASVFNSYSPYGFCLNNPLKFRDDTGRNPVIVIGGIVLVVNDLFWISTGAITAGIFLQKSADTGKWSLSPMLDQYNPGWDYQRRKDRDRKDALDRAQANVQKSIQDNFPDPDDFDPNNTPRIRKGGIWQRAFWATLIGISLVVPDENNVMTVRYWISILKDLLDEDDEQDDETAIDSKDDTSRRESQQQEYTNQQEDKSNPISNDRISYRNYLDQYFPQSNY